MDHKHILQAAYKDATYNYRLLIAAWSYSHVELACRLTLPSLMSAGNLGVLDNSQHKVPATMLCLSTDRARFEEAPSFKTLAQDRTISWHFVDAAVSLLGSAKEAILSQSFREVMSQCLRDQRDLRFLLIKPGTLLSEGSLGFVAEHLEEGAQAVLAPAPYVSLSALIGYLQSSDPSLSARSLATLLLQDSVALNSRLQGVEGGAGFPKSDRLARLNERCARFRFARWHPIGLRPADGVDATRESLLDSEITPEFSTLDSTIIRASSSDEVLILDPRPEPFLSAADRCEGLTATEAVSQMLSWTTPFYIQNLRNTYDLVGADESAEPPALEISLPSSGGVSATRHPAWLAARGLQRIPPALGGAKRYLSNLDGLYRAARLQIESIEVDQVIYAGYANREFAPLLSRHFGRAYTCEVARVLSTHELLSSSNEPTLFIVHLNLLSFQALAWSSLLPAIVAYMGAGQPFILNVDARDEDGGLSDLDHAELRRWYAEVVGHAQLHGCDVAIDSTLIQFFEGQPGFLIVIRPPRGQGDANQHIPLPRGHIRATAEIEATIL